MRRQGDAGMLEAACSTLAPGEHHVMHGDRGCHYRWPGWISICERHGLIRSMSAKGCSPDNSAAGASSAGSGTSSSTAGTGRASPPAPSWACSPLLCDTAMRGGSRSRWGGWVPRSSGGAWARRPKYGKMSAPPDPAILINDTFGLCVLSSVRVLGSNHVDGWCK